MTVQEVPQPGVKRLGWGHECYLDGTGQIGNVSKVSHSSTFRSSTVHEVFKCSSHELQLVQSNSAFCACVHVDTTKLKYYRANSIIHRGALRSGTD